jgi:glycosyltransferase involved in cell wall biosynthesis
MLTNSISKSKGASAQRPVAERTSTKGTQLDVTTVIPTVGRPALRRAVESVLTQDGPGFAAEVIVVNDTGRPLQADGWQESSRVRVVRTPAPKSRPAIGRNVGAEAASGQFLHFLDDDDWLLPGAFAAFARAHRAAPEARWLYGIVDRVTREGSRVDRLPIDLEGNVLAALISGEWMPLQGTLIHRDLFAETGGFDPSSPPSEDMDLLLRMGLIEDVCRVRRPVCAYSMGVEESATPRHLCSVRLFEAYERLFDRPETLSRALASAASPHLGGKVLRHYLISLKKALRQRKARTLVRRLWDAGRFLARSRAQVLTTSYWRAAASPRAGATP